MLVKDNADKLTMHLFDMPFCYIYKKNKKKNI